MQILFLNLIVSAFGLAELKPTNIMQQEAQWLIQALEKAHYNKVLISDLNSTSFLHSYIEKLDRQKLYFTKEEVNSFVSQYSPTIITYFKQGISILDLIFIINTKLKLPKDLVGQFHTWTMN